VIQVIIDPLSEALTKFIAESRERPGRKALAAVVLQRIDPSVAAFITARVVVNYIASPVAVQGLAVEVGTNVEDEMRFAQFEETRPQDYKGTQRFIKEGGHSWDRTKRKAVLAHAAKVHEIGWRPWSRADRLHVGMALIDMLLTVAGDMFELRTMPRQRGRGTMYRLEPTSALLEWAKQLDDLGALLRPAFMPTIEPPLPWTGFMAGGYHLPRLKRRLIRGRLSNETARHMAERSMTTVYDSVNAIQSTAWTVDPFILEVAEQCLAVGMEVPGLPVATPVESLLPPRPAGYDHEKGRHPATRIRSQAWANVNPAEKQSWKRKARKIYHAHARTVSRSFAAFQILTIAKTMLPHQRIYFPHNLDFRGRMYPLCPGLNPQGSDLSKGLLRFAESKPITERGAWWLAVHLANNFGVDKVSLEDRVKWVREQSDRIVACADDPYVTRWWLEADNPWQFLQACMEWKGYINEGPEFHTSLPITIDGSCNGIQHLAAMSLDPVAGAMVNLIPASKPADIYGSVAERLITNLAADLESNEPGLPPNPRYPDGPASWTNKQWANAWIGFGITRKLTKRPTMVQPYGGMMSSCQDYIAAHIGERVEDGEPAPWGDRSGMAARWLAPRLWRAMTEIITGPRLVMDWFQQAAKVVSKYGQPIVWETPTGFVCHQRYTDMETQRIKTRLGDTMIRLTLSTALEVGLDKRRQRQSISPNLIHSYDAAALMLTILTVWDQGVRSMTATHDCYGTLAPDMDLLAAATREQFVKLYNGTHVLMRLREQFLKDLPPEAEAEMPLPPTLGTLDITKVLESPFFFA
jgi:DNA-directed RNA polymerase